jgi:diguanylate cyclase (GGDEF)-like protein
VLRDRIEQALARSARAENSVVLLFLDLDGFKKVNDELGHEAGDALLVSVAHALRTAVRPSDTVVRYAGDEFVILCEHLSPREVDGFVARIGERLAGPHHLPGRQVTCTASIGFARADGHPDGAALLRAADEAMYARKAGRPAGEAH